MGTADRLARLSIEFHARFGGAPSVVARAPGRVELMGSHTDYNRCHVLTLPIDRDTWIAARPREDGQVRLISTAIEGESSFALDEPAAVPSWGRYVQGVARVLTGEGLPIRGLDAIVDTTLPLGGGLSSSAALECAAAILFGVLGGWTIEAPRMARLCQRAENEFVGVNCGILDQFSSCVSGDGGALLLDCADLSSRPVPIASDLSIVVCDTAAPREVGASEYSRRRVDCEEGARRLGAASLRDVPLDLFRRRAHELPAVVERRCRFILEEDRRVLDLSVALPAGDRQAIARIMAESFRGACDLFEIGAASMTAMMNAMAAAPGFIGGRQSGAGFGGCLVAVVELESVAAFARAVTTAYGAATGIEGRVFAVAPGEAAGVTAPAAPNSAPARGRPGPPSARVDQ